MKRSQTLDERRRRALKAVIELDGGETLDRLIVAFVSHDEETKAVAVGAGRAVVKYLELLQESRRPHGIATDAA